MKNIKIFPKEWLQLHPYQQSSPVDSYYTGIANRIYDILIQTELINSFEGDESKQISIRMAAYFEDVISGTGIWRTFILKNKEVHDKYVPFYTIDDHYYDDEVNQEDVRFLIWHYTQQYHGERKGTFVNPDNPAQEMAANLIYNLFCDEWTTAPENQKMQLLFAPETRYQDKEAYDQLLYWFHYDMYLHSNAKAEMTETIKDFYKQYPDADLNQLIPGIHESLAYMGKTCFLGYSSPEWLGLIMPETHPDHNFFLEESKRVQGFNDKQAEESKEANAESYRKFTEAANGQLFIYLKGKEELLHFITDKMSMGSDYIQKLPEDRSYQKIAIYATPHEGLQLIAEGVDQIKDENNPFYNEKEASEQALGFFIVKHCNVRQLKEMVNRGMLADAQTKSLTSPERGKAIIQENWAFLTSYFQKERMDL